MDLKSIEWVREMPETKPVPDWARIKQKPQDRTVDQMLASGEIAAMMLPRPPQLSPEEMPSIRRLFSDYVEVEQEYRLRLGVDRSFGALSEIACIVLDPDLSERSPA